MPIPFLVDVGLLLVSVVTALIGVLLLLVGLYDIAISQLRGRHQRLRTGAVMLALGAAVIGAGYLLQLGI